MLQIDYRGFHVPHTLTAKEQTLQKIFSDEYVFTIPGYQRPYSWGNDQAQELLDDLLSALEVSPEQLGDCVPYFLGSIVLIKSETSPDATVVDGQQRLTTLTLLLSAIRATISDRAVQVGITKRIYEHGDVVSATEASYRLSLRERDRDFFRQYIQHEDGLAKLIELNSTLPTSAQERLRSNAKVFMSGLSKLQEVELKRLVQFIITRCYLVTVATPDLDSAYRIFGVLNSRGLDLSATDILKAEIIGGIEPGLREMYTKKWEDAEEDLGRDEFGDLFSHIRMVYRKAKPQGTLLKEFKEHVTQAAESQTLVDSVLLPMARAFAALTDADYASTRHAELVNEHLRWLNKLEFKDWLPPALAFYVRHSEHPDLMLTFFRDLERLAYSMLARKIGVNGRIERFSALTGAIENGQNLFAEASPLQLSPSEQYDTYSVLNGPLYDTHSARAVALLLLRLDRLLSDGSAVYEHEVVSVEHVMPQQPAPNSQWATWVPDAKIYQSWVHRLGNLVLLSRKKNSSASNREFSWKKNSYFTKGGVSSFALTTQVLQHSEWTVDIMQAQQASMMLVFETHWRLEERKSKSDIAKELLGELSSDSDGIYFELESAKHGLAAVARKSSSAFTILAQSQARLEWTGQPHSYQQLRESLRTFGSLQLSADGSHLVFTQDVNFVSPSAASATVLGRTDNGRNSWRLKGTTITYAAWQDNLPADKSPSETEGDGQ
ncbi:DUF4357 domain-containing protein [Burkholderia cenocepacia]|uniref:DUF4357 domain-containing protein n=1 Tax=Burkholderia cepacia complex TaxID=87882 RepID=UPI000A73A4B3|nr:MULTISPECIES: DUF4357 domain-containing protein [Burkholderia cepacia complex]MDA3671200.1 DUF4357 domain-containing protein [Burkholderia cenocepacia]MDA3680770.1 DUF4357 domain-containing protein [Burkholderia cenocepacia]MDA3688452.1 DUF4357 domain-containing protein [Burkholderia cenocepacia]MDA3695655.1 DUF4357 domain-containing protein [Burkholderia cenocepacia]MDA3703201.1 DUF4357 domain-containing protein [Burkholderia cenocepacia]